MEPCRYEETIHEIKVCLFGRDGERGVKDKNNVLWDEREERREFMRRLWVGVGLMVMANIGTIILTAIQLLKGN